MSCGLSATEGRTVHSSTSQTHQNRLLLWSNFKSILRTVRSPLADCPQHTYANPPETTTSLDKFLILTADRPAPLGGPSGPPWRTVRSSLCPTTRDDNVSRQNPRLYDGLSALQKRTVRSSTLWNPPETTSSLDKVRTLRRTVRSPIADRPQFNSVKPSETTTSLDNF